VDVFSVVGAIKVVDAGVDETFVVRRLSWKTDSSITTTEGDKTPTYSFLNKKTTTKDKVV
jgi:hypothetical protein